MTHAFLGPVFKSFIPLVFKSFASIVSPMCKHTTVRKVYLLDLFICLAAIKY